MFKGKVSKVLVFGLACMAVVAMLALSACGGGSSQSSSSSSSSATDGEYKLVTPGTLTVATSPDYAPMEYQENGEIKGYDIALIKEIAKHLGLNADIQNQAFDSLVTQVAGGKTFDCAISSITISAPSRSPSPMRTMIPISPSSSSRIPMSRAAMRSTGSPSALSPVPRVRIGPRRT